MGPDDSLAPVTITFFLIQWRPTVSNVPVPHLLSTLRSPAVMHKPAGQRRTESPWKYRVICSFWRVVDDTPYLSDKGGHYDDPASGGGHDRLVQNDRCGLAFCRVAAGHDPNLEAHLTTA
jgi:hypothetical protein